jgi:hypothetical protein
MNSRWIVVVIALVGGCGYSSHCAPGEKGCACVAQSCNTGLVCNAGSCVDESRASLSVDGNARGCEVVLHETKGRLSRVVFGNEVNGKWLRQGDKLATAFIVNHDRSIGGGEVQVGYSGDFEIMKSHCYGVSGEELPGAQVRR